MRQGLYKRFKCLKIFNEFFMYLFRWRKGGGALMHVYVLEHIISLSYRTAWWMFTKLDRDEVLIITHLFIGFSANSNQRRIQGEGGGGNLPKIGQLGVLSPKDFFFSLSYRTTWWMFTKLDRHEVLIITHLFIGFSANSTQGRRQFAKNRSISGSFSKGLLLQIGMQQQQTECIPVSWIEIHVLRLLLFWLISQIWQSCFLIC